MPKGTKTNWTMCISFTCEERKIFAVNWKRCYSRTARHCCYEHADKQPTQIYVLRTGLLSQLLTVPWWRNALNKNSLFSVSHSLQTLTDDHPPTHDLHQTTACQNRGHDHIYPTKTFTSTELYVDIRNQSRYQ